MLSEPSYSKTSRFKEFLNILIIDVLKEFIPIGISYRNDLTADRNPAALYTLDLIKRNDIRFMYPDKLPGRKGLLHFLHVLQGDYTFRSGINRNVVFKTLDIQDVIQFYFLDLMFSFHKDKILY